VRSQFRGIGILPRFPTHRLEADAKSNAIPKSGQKFPETEEIFAQPGMTAPLQLDQD
jgi:hypothetical protein